MPPTMAHHNRVSGPSTWLCARTSASPHCLSRPIPHPPPSPRQTMLHGVSFRLSHTLIFISMDQSPLVMPSTTFPHSTGETPPILPVKCHKTLTPLYRYTERLYDDAWPSVQRPLNGERFGLPHPEGKFYRFEPSSEYQMWVREGAAEVTHHFTQIFSAQVIERCVDLLTDSVFNPYPLSQRDAHTTSSWGQSPRFVYLCNVWGAY